MIYPIGDKILVKPLPMEEMTEGGLYIPDTVRSTPDKGEIVEVGDGVTEPKMIKGTIVFFRKDSGFAVKEDNTEFIVLPMKEVIGISKNG